MSTAPAQGTTAKAPSRSDVAQYARLGTGDKNDRLNFRLVVGLLTRCISLLRPVGGHVVGLMIASTIASAILLPATLFLYDLLWNRALMGDPLTLEAAQRTGLDPELWAHVSQLSAELRRDSARFGMLVGAVLSAILIPFFLSLYYWKVWILQRVNQLLRATTMARLQSLSLRFHSENQVGDAIYRLYQDSAMVTQLIDVLFLTPFFACLRFVFMLGIVYFFRPELALVLLLIWPPALLLSGFYSKRLRIGFRAAREANSALTSRIQETLAGIRVIKAYGAESREQKRFEAQSRNAFDHARGVRMQLVQFNVGTFWIVGIVLLINIAWSTILTRDGAPMLAGSVTGVAELAFWNLGLYSAFKFLLGSATDQVRVLLRTWGRTQDIAIGLDRVFELIDREPEVKDAIDAVALPPVRYEIVFSGVSFSYTPERSTLVDVDLRAKVGTISAIIGPTGSGKSTLMALLLRLFDPDSGCISIDGVDIRQFTTSSLRDRVSVALQENVLFGTTIRENIRYADPDASDAQVREAARVACADEFIEALPQGYDTPLGERGTKLSTGQRQRLSIARALLKDTDILILDEPTAALDAETEMRVLANLAEWGKGRLIFLITHRLSTIRRADRIVFIDAGRVVEQGGHEELMDLSTGAYRHLVATETETALRAITP